MRYFESHNGKIVQLVLDYDLRASLEDKLHELSKRADIAILVNRRQRLAHVMLQGESEYFVRARLPETFALLSRKGKVRWSIMRFQRLL